MISLRNPARTRQERDRLARGLAGSAAIHVTAFLVWLAAGPPAPVAPLGEIQIYPDAVELVDVEMTASEPAFSNVAGPAEAAAGGADSEGGPAGDLPPSIAPEPERPTPPALAPVRSERPNVRPAGRPTPAPVERRDPPRPSTAPTPGRTATAPRPTGPTRPVERPGTGTQAGTGQGTGPGEGRADGGGTGSGAGAGAGAGSDGTGTREVGFALGNRTYDCPTPAFGGTPGEVTLTLTFRPDGGFVSSSGSGGNPALVRVARAVVNRCRAQPLPARARQVNQTTAATFRFVAG